MSEQAIKPHLWTAEEAAEYWRVHIKTVYRWIKEGRIMHIPVNTGYRIPHEQVLRGCPPDDAD